VLLVSDAELVDTMKWMLERMKVLVEPSGVAGAAAVRHRKADFRGRRVGVVLSGGNVDLARLAEYVSTAGDDPPRGAVVAAAPRGRRRCRRTTSGSSLRPSRRTRTASSRSASWSGRSSGASRSRATPR
jgi:hypothetical protein